MSKNVLLYGEETIQLNIRVPKSKKSEIRDRFRDILVEYENPKIVIPANSLKVGDVIEFEAEAKLDSEKSTASGSNIKVTPEKKEVDVNALRKIANGQGLKSELFEKKKLPLDELYEFEYVKSLPDIDNQVAIDSKGISLYDRYDPGIFYVKWEGKYLRFEDKAEFDRFAKDNNIK